MPKKKIKSTAKKLYNDLGKIGKSTKKLITNLLKRARIKKTKRRRRQKKKINFKALGLKGIIVIVLAGAIIFMLLLTALPSPRQLATYPYPASNQFYDRNGNLLYESYIEKNRVPIELEDLPDHLIKATIAIEDKNFYSHFGFDLVGISRALINTIFKKRLQGGSTITQQLVKNALLTQNRTITRKIKEAILTVMTELIYSKDEILTMYFNQIPYGGTAYGIEAAARTFFNKRAADLSLAESALLAGLPAATTSYSPFIHPDNAKSKQEIVLQKMKDQGYISQEELEQAKGQKLEYASPGAKIKAPHFVFYVQDLLVEKYGEQINQQGGFKIKTTLDLDLQNFAQETVAKEIEGLKYAKVSNGAALVTNPATGEILAMVGSKNYFDQEIEGKFNVTTALRQPGSAIKPINYAIGLALGHVTPATVFADVPTCFVGGPKKYCPKNYDNLFHGGVQLRYALGNSFNVPAVRMLAKNGIETFIASASAMGLDSLGKRDPSEFGLSLTLGGGEVKMTEMATAFGTLANLGIRQNLSAILEIKDRYNRVIESLKPEQGERALPMAAAYLITHILSDNGARSAAFGSHSDLVIKNHPEVAVKTGTTNDKRDNWTIGYTPSFVVAVWVGNNDNSPMGYVASGVTGASPIWHKIMSHILKDKDQEFQKKPANVVGSSICNLTGLSPTTEGCELRYEFFINGTVPPATPIRQPILIDKDTNTPVQPGEEKPNVEWQEHSIVRDPLGTIICFDCSQTQEPVIINPFASSFRANN